jgi:hypothetical protein
MLDTNDLVNMPFVDTTDVKDRRFCVERESR